MEIKRISKDDPLFPASLDEVYRPPTALYIRGGIPSGPAVAVVGTRKMTEYGRRCAGLLAPELVRCGRIIVSGLALGIDGVAHAAALEVGGRTVAVIGSGVDDVSLYPRAHLGLARRIISSGAVLSEYPPGTHARAYHFPERNRIIVGLSQAVLVIEAPKKSGAMITARLALDAGREVWAVPGPITSAESWGPNELIRNGATPICGPEDIAHALGLAPAKTGPGPDLSRLPADERAVAELLRRGARSADEIARAIGLLPGAVGILLTALELEGVVVSLGGGRFALYT